MTDAQRWFILMWLGALSCIGATALVFGVNPNVAGWVFGTPLGMLCAYGFAKYID